MTSKKSGPVISNPSAELAIVRLLRQEGIARRGF
jgi:hypothetical protein